jgi:hypothetical protein
MFFLSKENIAYIYKKLYSGQKISDPKVKQCLIDEIIISMKFILKQINFNNVNDSNINNILDQFNLNTIKYHQNRINLNDIIKKVKPENKQPIDSFGRINANSITNKNVNTQDRIGFASSLSAQNNDFDDKKKTVENVVSERNKFISEAEKKPTDVPDFLRPQVIKKNKSNDTTVNTANQDSTLLTNTAKQDSILLTNTTDKEDNLLSSFNSNNLNQQDNIEFMLNDDRKHLIAKLQNDLNGEKNNDVNVSAETDNLVKNNISPIIPVTIPAIVPVRSNNEGAVRAATPAAPEINKNYQMKTNIVQEETFLNLQFSNTLSAFLWEFNRIKNVTKIVLMSYSIPEIKYNININVNDTLIIEVRKEGENKKEEITERITVKIQFGYYTIYNIIEELNKELNKLGLVLENNEITQKLIITNNDTDKIKSFSVVETQLSKYNLGFYKNNNSNFIIEADTSWDLRSQHKLQLYLNNIKNNEPIFIIYDKPSSKYIKMEIEFVKPIDISEFDISIKDIYNNIFPFYNQVYYLDFIVSKRRSTVY